MIYNPFFCVCVRVCMVCVCVCTLINLKYNEVLSVSINSLIALLLINFDCILKNISINQFVFFFSVAGRERTRRQPPAVHPPESFGGGGEERPLPPHGEWQPHAFLRRTFRKNEVCYTEKTIFPFPFILNGI